ncbi:phage antirepressor KilAC domain-containing protein [Anaerophaga thermohalophila]|jgi:phage antirepressor YoqD-like protein|uniref:phage antirepressor KilAC domain-containing protein n=1 Tax=Anaerophaga thermohalophila TaxID=177400 RepID=UPI000237C82E|nr:phage antirepressor KilAC domain-containing protein [Anaerophaga thermohalophila]
MKSKTLTSREIAEITGMKNESIEEAIRNLSKLSEVTTIQHKGFLAGMYDSEPAPVVIEQFFNILGKVKTHVSINPAGLKLLAQHLPPGPAGRLPLPGKTEKPVKRVYQPAEVSTPGRYITFGDFAKIYFREFRLGRNTLIKKLREKRFLQPNNIPYQRYLKSGFFVVETAPFRGDRHTPEEKQRIAYTTKLTHKGALWLREELAKMD